MRKRTSSRAILGITLGACILLASVRQTPEAAHAAPAVEKRTATAAVPHVAALAATHLPASPAADLHAVELAVQQARTRGQGEGEAYRLRAAALSAQTIAMLTERELAEKSWMQRVGAWRVQSSRMDQGDAAGLQALRDQWFSGEEQARLQAYETGDTPALIQR